jgi:fibro-slime domain-containing protein
MRSNVPPRGLTLCCAYLATLSVSIQACSRGELPDAASPAIGTSGGARGAVAGASAGAVAGSTGATSNAPSPRAGAASPALAPSNAPGSSAAGPMPVPADFTKTEIGGYKLGPLLTANPPPTTPSEPAEAHRCSVMTGVIRDFKGIEEPDGHPDFEAFEGSSPTRGLVATNLGSDSKPIYASRCEANPDAAACPFGQMSTSQARFDQWYRSTPDVDRPFAVYLSFQPNAGVYTFQSMSFFPVDGSGWGNPAGKGHNFGFTTEIHATMLYKGGEHFSFTGDDDLWVFINGKLAIDLGGLHPSASDTLDLDSAASSLGIIPGQSYALDLFHAERHSEASNFRVDTTLEFTECGSVTTPD